MQPLSEYAQVVLDANGNGAVQIGPDKSNESWQIQVCTVSVSSNASEPQFRVYFGSSTAITSLIQGTYAGSFDTDTTFNYTLNNSGKLTCVWTGGDPGATATVTFHGQQVF
jgi:hypothetical protein